MPRQVSVMIVFIEIEFFICEYSKSGAKSDWLMKAEVSEMSMDECRIRYGPVNLRSLRDNVINSQICARDENEDPADSCQGKFVDFLIIRFNFV